MSLRFFTKESLLVTYGYIYAALTDNGTIGQSNGGVALQMKKVSNGSLQKEEPCKKEAKVVITTKTMKDKQTGEVIRQETYVKVPGREPQLCATKIFRKCLTATKNHGVFVVNHGAVATDTPGEHNNTNSPNIHSKPLTRAEKAEKERAKRIRLKANKKEKAVEQEKAEKAEKEKEKAVEQKIHDIAAIVVKEIEETFANPKELPSKHSPAVALQGEGRTLQVRQVGAVVFPPQFWDGIRELIDLDDRVRRTSEVEFRGVIDLRFSKRMAALLEDVKFPADHHCGLPPLTTFIDHETENGLKNLNPAK